MKTVVSIILLALFLTVSGLSADDKQSQNLICYGITAIAILVLTVLVYWFGASGNQRGAPCTDAIPPSGINELQEMSMADESACQNQPERIASLGGLPASPRPAPLQGEEELSRSQSVCNYQSGTRPFATVSPSRVNVSHEETWRAGSAADKKTSTVEDETSHWEDEESASSSPSLPEDFTASNTESSPREDTFSPSRPNTERSPREDTSETEEDDYSFVEHSSSGIGSDNELSQSRSSVNLDQSGLPEDSGATPVAKQQLDLLLIGKTGHGKSATGNSILQCQVFRTSTNVSSATFDVQDAWAETEDYILKVIDAPGFSETRLDSNEKIAKACDDMAKAMQLCLNGFHAIILVLKFGNRFTEEEQDAIRMLKSIFGEDIIRDYCVIVVTHGDSFDANSDEIDSFSEWLTQQEGPAKSIFKECSYRCVLFRNKTKDPKAKQTQVLELLNMVRNLKHRDVRYTNDHFNKVKTQRDRLIVEAKAPYLKEEILKETGLIVADLSQLRDNQDLDRNDEILHRLASRIRDLLTQLESEDNGTGVLDKLKSDMTSLAESVKAQKLVNAQRREDRQCQIEMEREHSIRLQELEQQHIEAQLKLKQQLQTASHEERTALLQKLEEHNRQANENMVLLKENFEENMKNARDEESLKWKTTLAELTSTHTEQMQSLKSQYANMNKENEAVMKATIDDLKEQIQEMQQKTTAPPKDPNKVSVKCQDQQSRFVECAIDKHSPMGQVLRAYCDQYGRDIQTLRFYLDTVPVQTGDTPASLSLEDGDVIDVFDQQEGGSSYLLLHQS